MGLGLAAWSPGWCAAAASEGLNLQGWGLRSVALSSVHCPWSAGGDDGLLRSAFNGCDLICWVVGHGLE